MLDSIFNSENVVFRAITKFGYVWYLHVLWLLCSLPIITIGASTSAFFYCCFKIRAGEDYVTKNFFHSFRENFKQGTMLFALYLMVGAILIADLWLGKETTGQIGQIVRMGAWILLFPYSMSLFYVFAIQAKFVNSIKNTILYSFVLSIRHLWLTIQMILIVIAVIYLNCMYYLANYITISLGFGVMMYLLSAYYQKIFRNYLPEDETEDETEDASSKEGFHPEST